MSRISRRDTLTAGLGAGLAALGTTGAHAQPVTSGTAMVTLLLVNDIYKMGEESGRGGFARLNAIVKAERARGTPLLYVHAGDMFSPVADVRLRPGRPHGRALATSRLPTCSSRATTSSTSARRPTSSVVRNRGSPGSPPTCAPRMALGPARPSRMVASSISASIKLGVFGVALAESRRSVSSTGDIRFLPDHGDGATRIRQQHCGATGADLIVCRCTHTDR